MGEVWKARDTRLGRFVAVKVLPEHIARRADLRQRFEREARAVASLNHPHICVLFDIGNREGADFMVTEYLEGETLAERMGKGALPLDQALRFASQAADALDRAHRAGVTHRDVKPGNIMLTRDGVKVLDFGPGRSPRARRGGRRGRDRPRCRAVRSFATRARTKTRGPPEANWVCECASRAGGPDRPAWRGSFRQRRADRGP